MKKRIANGVQLVLMLVSFVLLWVPCVKLQYVDLIRDMPIDASMVDIMKYQGTVYSVFAVFAITAILCIISIIVKPEHKDGKIHVILSIVLFFFATMSIVNEGSAVGEEWMVVESKFPTYLYLACLVGAIVVSIAKRSTIITGLPSKKEKVVINNNQTTTNADELKKYKDLLDSGAITQEEFDKKKNHLLNLQ